MHMPVLSGFELAARARRYRGKLPVLYLSGQLPAGFARPGGSAGYLARPFTLRELAASIHELTTTVATA
jgi:CheY-like chemotaxis protein